MPGSAPDVVGLVCPWAAPAWVAPSGLRARGAAAGAAQYATFQWVGCSHCSSWSPQKRLYVVRGSKPRISLSSWIRKENVETDVPMKNLPSSATVTCPRDEPPAARPAWALGAR